MANRAVPRTTEVVRGAVVNIVLKADQRTGREVRGTVRDVLTRGDHHRGIKVRLADGRIGRVQSIASSASAASASPSSSSDPDGAILINAPAPAEDESADAANRTVSNSRGHRPRYRDMRLDEPLEAPPEQTDLGAYIVPAKRKGKGKGKGKNHNDSNAPGQHDGPARRDDVSSSNDSSSVLDVVSATATCPVCGNFEGDETAVAHHVAEHFE
ncbi:uncharacterized protein F4807DRAFT_50586 [Annulohypoxylon truncatum]|uniref:uncharacterized protein n=1 Tax=Annulohypoxylon truncatum TaxID=327061 RepID=UPI0020075C3B|nr:uncharacterized protein F4807DRAFT_50586 [Annulohypoxylon truncatum]KAI1211118.1 hypothetical protein F4807DRAFT_50586 [Annulohypoxylon truncatum]